MRRIVLDMQNGLFGNAISGTFRWSENGFDARSLGVPDRVVDECKWISPCTNDVINMEGGATKR